MQPQRLDFAYVAANFGVAQRFWVNLVVGVVMAYAWSPWTPPASQCLQSDGTLAPCGPGNEICNGANGPPGPFGRNTPQFHVRDKSCGINDPVSPVYDPVHGIYHVHWENHVGRHGGYTHGHAVSRDFAHWAHLPIDIWNDQPYDNVAIYTGSATVVDGMVIQVYAGHCNPKEPGCPGGTNLCIVVPSDPSDPLQSNLSKTWVQNPIVNDTQGDPSTAWRTRHGEWRFTTSDSQIYGSLDFKTWYRIGPAPGFAHGACPSFFPLPRRTPDAGTAPNTSTKFPTHVHKVSDGGDWMCVGTYNEGPIKTTGTFTATPGIMARKIDQGAFYASKDFYDPVKQRRINWGWAEVHPASTHSLPREVTWHPELQQLVFSPLEEQNILRENRIGHLETVLRSSRPAVSLGLPKWIGNTSEVIVSFVRPTSSVQLGVKVMVGSQSGYTGTLFTVDYLHEPTKISRVRVRGGQYNDTLQLLPSDKAVDIHLYVDNTMTEAYWMGGRVAMTVDTPATDEADMTFSIDSLGGEEPPDVPVTATAWSVEPIWVSTAEILRTPRLDGKPIEAGLHYENLHI